MKHKEKIKSIFLLSLGIIFFISIFIFPIFLKKQNVPLSNENVVQNDKKQENSENIQKGTTQVQENISKQEIEKKKEWKRIEYNLENQVSPRMGYSTEREEFGVAEQKEYNLIPIKNENQEEIKVATGHTLYKSLQNDNLFIISGETPIQYINGQIRPVSFLRAEHSKERIRVFNNQEEIDSFLSAWQAGQRVLSGETYADKGTVLIDGVMTDIKFNWEQNDVTFNLLDVMKEIVPDSYYTKGDPFFNVFLDENTVQLIPTSSATVQYQDLNLNLVRNTYTFHGLNEEKIPFEYTANILDNITLKAYGKDMQVILGWEFYTNGDVLSIVSAKENISQKAVVYNFNGKSGYIVRIEVGEDGLYYQNKYNAKGELVDSKVFIEDELPEVEVEEEIENEQEIEEDIIV